MPKQKTHRGAAKRFKITAGGKVMRRKATKNHMLSKKTTKQKRGLRRDALVAPGFAKQIKAII